MQGAANRLRVECRAELLVGIPAGELAGAKLFAEEGPAGREQPPRHAAIDLAAGKKREEKRRERGRDEESRQAAGASRAHRSIVTRPRRLAASSLTVTLGHFRENLLDGNILRRRNRAQIEQHLALLDAGDDRRVGLPQARREVFGCEWRE